MLAFNGWVAGWLVRRATGSAFWAALAILLITWNEPTSFRMTGHLHLFKYGWLLLAVWAFSRYLDAPSTRRGVALGLAAAGVLQGSFYFGFFLALTLGAAWLGCLIAGTLDRRHAVPTVAAAVTFVAAAAVATFPVWAITKGYPLADQFAHHPWKHTWYFSSEPWQWLVSRSSQAAFRYIEEVGVKDPGLYFEGWSFPGYAVLAGIAVYAAGRLRGLRSCDRDEGRRFLDVAMVQLALLVGLSVTGGASYFFFRLVPSIRCYGRSSLMGLVGLGCVAAPVCLHALTRRCRFRLTRAGIMAASVALVAYDFANLQRTFAWTPKSPDTTPAWVDWLAGQPPKVKLAAFGPTGLDYWYGTLAYAVRHGHTALNGCDFDLLNGDLALLGASYSRMNPEGLRFVASLGFETMAVHRTYLEAHPWIGTLPWLGAGRRWATGGSTRPTPDSRRSPPPPRPSSWHARATGRTRPRSRPRAGSPASSTSIGPSWSASRCGPISPGPTPPGSCWASPAWASTSTSSGPTSPPIRSRRRRRRGRTGSSSSTSGGDAWARSPSWCRPGCSPAGWPRGAVGPGSLSAR